MNAAPAWVDAYIGLGSNLQQPHQQITTAIQEIAALQGVRQVEVSPLYRTAPIGPQDQPDFINGVLRLQTCLPPLDLLAALQAIEQTHGRVRVQHWGARSLDLDILLYGTQVIDLPSLQIPHPQIVHRAFVLKPLADLAALDLLIPGYGCLAELLAGCPDDRVERLVA